MTLYEKVKDAIRKGHSDLQIAAVYGCSESLVRKTREVIQQSDKDKPATPQSS